MYFAININNRETKVNHAVIDNRMYNDHPDVRKKELSVVFGHNYIIIILLVVDHIFYII
jgi:hypothetical protein